MSLIAPGDDCAPLRTIDPPLDGPAEWRSAGTAHLAGAATATNPQSGSVSRILYGAGGGRLHLRFGDVEPRFARVTVDGGVAGRLVVERAVRNLAIAMRDDSVDFSVVVEEPGRPAERVPPTGTLHVDAPPPGLTRPLRVLIAAAECAPLAAAGQLAVVVAEAVAAAAALGNDVVLAIPLHRGADPGLHPGVRVADLQCASSGRVVVGRVIQGGLPGLGVPVLSVDVPAYFDRDAPYGDDDDGERYLAFCAMVDALLRATAFAPDIVHGFEWQTAALLATVAATDSAPATVFSVADDAPGYRVPAAALSGSAIADDGHGSVDLIDVGREVATVVARSPAPGRLASFYGSALQMARSRP